MPTARKLKVFRTASGFHDAYVAAPSRKAALEAWGATTDLFAMGSAEQVTDPKLMAAALAHPGEVVRESRGSAAEHLRAAGKPVPRGKAPRAATAIEAAQPDKPAPPPSPPPNRKAVDRASAALDAFETSVQAELEALREREAALEKERATLEAKLEQGRARLQDRLDRARSDHEEALAAWRETS